MLLNFGVHKNKAISAIPTGYLAWLACYEVEDDGEYIRIVDNTSTKWRFPWLLKYKREYIIAARQEMKRRRICFHCRKVMPTIGTHRKNGVTHHSDWAGRLFHKCCWNALN